MFNSNRLPSLATVLQTGPGRRWFGDLKIRPKLMVLHNVFFLTLSLSVYAALIPLFEQRVATARQREVALAREYLTQVRPGSRFPDATREEYREGTASEMQLAPDVKAILDANPGNVYQQTLNSEFLYHKEPFSGLYRRLRLPSAPYDALLWQARLTLLIVLGVVYALAIMALEWLIMPNLVYRPLRLFLQADEAAQHGDREHELIGKEEILDDEIGQIMESRNNSIRELRRQEDELASALTRLEQSAEDLQSKNEMLETAKQNLEAQDRLASLGLLSASVAHEMNTPLAVLHGSIEKLIETVPNAAAQERLARMLRVTQRLRTISEGLVDFARVRRQEMEEVGLRPLLDEAWSLVAIDEKASTVRFLNEIEPHEVAIGNADRLIQVFVNLLWNALYAINAEGQVCVRSARLRHDGQTWVRIQVNDDGPGIPPTVLPGIFDAFVSTRLDSRGTGLGLTVAQGIVQQHGGTITAENRPEGGARLEVTLRTPSSQAPVTQAPMTQVITSQAPLNEVVP